MCIEATEVQFDAQVCEIDDIGVKENYSWLLKDLALVMHVSLRIATSRRDLHSIEHTSSVPPVACHYYCCTTRKYLRPIYIR
jgi:hypothetical protein